LGPPADAPDEPELPTAQVSMRVRQEVRSRLLEHRREEGTGVPPARHHHGMAPGRGEASSDRAAERAPRPLDDVPFPVGLSRARARPETARLAHGQPAAGRLVAQDLSGEEPANVLEVRPTLERPVALE